MKSFNDMHNDILPWPKNRYSRDIHKIDPQCDHVISRDIDFDLQRELATRSYRESRRCRTEAQYRTISHDRTVDQPHELLGCNDFFGQGSTRNHKPVYLGLTHAFARPRGFAWMWLRRLRIERVSPRQCPSFASLARLLLHSRPAEFAPLRSCRRGPPCSPGETWGRGIGWCRLQRLTSWPTSGGAAFRRGRIALSAQQAVFLFPHSWFLLLSPWLQEPCSAPPLTPGGGSELHGCARPFSTWCPFW